jgi:hypothetical protein
VVASELQLWQAVTREANLKAQQEYFHARSCTALPAAQKLFRPP